MTKARQDASLELEHDPAFHRREWRISTIAWLVFVAVMLATALGVFGAGPLSRARAGNPSGPLWVEYERFARFGTSQRVIVHAAAQADGTARFTIGRSVPEAFQIVRLTPEPLSSALVAEGIEYRFEARAGHSPIVVELQAARPWVVQATISSPGAAVEFSQFVYP